MEEFSKLPDGTIFEFDEGPIMMVTSENKACSAPGKLIARTFDLPIEMAGFFVTDADGHRGVVGTVLKEGIIKPNMQLTVILPKE